MTKLLIMISLIMSTSVSAGYWGLKCTTAYGDFTFEDSRPGTILEISDKEWNKTKIMLGLQDDRYIIVKESQKNIMTKKNDCIYDTSYVLETYSAKVTLSYSDGESFPKNTRNLSEDGKSLVLDMICSYEASGGFCGNPDDL